MSDKPTESSPLESEISRRDLLARAGRVGAAAVVAGALAGPAGAAARRVTKQSAKKVPTGGTATWALEQDPGGIYPFGATLTINHTANEMMYDSLLEWDPKLNIRPALATSYTVVNSKRIVWNLRKGVHLPQRPGDDGRRRRLLVPADAEPAAAGHDRDGRAAARDRGRRAALEVPGADGPQGAGRPRLRRDGLGPLHLDRPEQHVPDPESESRRASAPARTC